MTCQDGGDKKVQRWANSATLLRDFNADTWQMKKKPFPENWNSDHLEKSVSYFSRGALQEKNNVIHYQSGEGYHEDKEQKGEGRLLKGLEAVEKNEAPYPWFYS